MSTCYDTRWQKCRGWNSLSSTSFGVDLLSGLAIYVSCYHRASPSDLERMSNIDVDECDVDDEDESCEVKWQKTFTDKSSKGLDALGAADMVKEMHSLTCEISTIIKDGDSSSLKQAKAAKHEIISNLPDDERDLYDESITELLCARHHGKNAMKKLGSVWNKKWKVSKKRVTGYMRGTIKMILRKHKGDAMGIANRIKSLLKHLRGDHSLCEPSAPCKSNGDYKQTLIVHSDEAMACLKSVMDDYYNIDIIESLKWDLTTNTVESLNQDIICLHPKRMFSRCGGLRECSG